MRSFLEKHKKYLIEKKGFTLIEVITVIVLLGVVLAIGLPRYSVIRAQSEWESDVVTLNNMEKAAEMYYLLEKEEGFPSGPGGVISDYTSPSGEIITVVEVNPTMLESLGLFDKGVALKRMRKEIYYGPDCLDQPYSGNAWDSVSNTEKFTLGDFYIFARVNLETGERIWQDTDNDGVNDWIGYYLGSKPR